MNRLLMLMLVIVLMLGACVYPPEWGNDPAPTDPAMVLPPGVSDQPMVLPYPELPWNHPCNNGAGGCDSNEDNEEGY